MGRLDETLRRHGLMTRGAAPSDGGEKTVILVGHAGGTIWPYFSAWRANDPGPECPDPLDRWSKQVIGAAAAAFGAQAVFPSDRPYRPFQQWAMQAEGLRPSPLGMLIHPEFGLWHAYRGALLFDGAVAAPAASRPAHPCDSCRAKPCLTACPVGAFDGAGYDVGACRSHLGSGRGTACLSCGCLARDACPVGRAYAYDEPQRRFHMAAFAAA
ncbi:MAG: hypothetical protein ACTHJ3_01950 [Pararhizobium sp.]